MPLVTLLLAAGCLLAVGLALLPRWRQAHADKTTHPLDEVDEERLGLSARWDPYRPEDRLTNRMRMARQQASERRQRTDYYAVLGVTPGASDAEIERAFRARVIEVHPDRYVGDPAAQEQAAAQLRQVNQAVKVLRDPLARARYDAGRHPQA